MRVLEYASTENAGTKVLSQDRANAEYARTKSCIEEVKYRPRINITRDSVAHAQTDLF
jgi:hypothetical protein